MSWRHRQQSTHNTPDSSTVLRLAARDWAFAALARARNSLVTSIFLYGSQRRCLLVTRSLMNTASRCVVLCLVLLLVSTFRTLPPVGSSLCLLFFISCDFAECETVLLVTVAHDLSSALTHAVASLTRNRVRLGNTMLPPTLVRERGSRQLD